MDDITAVQCPRLWRGDGRGSLYHIFPDIKRAGAGYSDDPDACLTVGRRQRVDSFFLRVRRNNGSDGVPALGRQPRNSNAVQSS